MCRFLLSRAVCDRQERVGAICRQGSGLHAGELGGCAPESIDEGFVADLLVGLPRLGELLLYIEAPRVPVDARSASEEVRVTEGFDTAVG
jgi:hypothetical protein